MPVVSELARAVMWVLVMIEKIAIAISSAPFPSERSLKNARAALKAMLEPTAKMSLAGARSIGKTMGVANHTERAAQCFRVMITAAMEGDGE